MARILVIDDCAVFRAVVCCYLTSLGHQVRTATDGAQGITSYKSEPADVVLLDVFMPVKDGVETLGELVQHDPKARVIAVSGGGVHRNMTLLQTMLLLGARVALIKPMTLEKLKSAIEDALACNAGVSRQTAAFIA